jgi:hypothetical protein
MDPNARQYGPAGKFWWWFGIIGVLIVTRWWIGVAVFGAASIPVMVLWALVKRGGGQVKSAPGGRAAMRHTANGWEREGK